MLTQRTNAQSDSIPRTNPLAKPPRADLEHGPITDDIDRRPSRRPRLLGDQPPRLPRRRLQDLSRGQVRRSQVLLDGLSDLVQGDDGDGTPFDDGLRIDGDAGHPVVGGTGMRRVVRLMPDTPASEFAVLDFQEAEVDQQAACVSCR